MAMWSSAKAPSTASWAARWRLTHPAQPRTAPAYPPTTVPAASLRCATDSIPSRHPPRHPPRQVGAVGTLIATFVKRDQVKDRLKCPYCEGTGIIQCAPPPLFLAYPA